MQSILCRIAASVLGPVADAALVAVLDGASHLLRCVVELHDDSLCLLRGVVRHFDTTA